MTAAKPIVGAERALFLNAMAEALAQHPVRGVGLVHRLAAELQRRFIVSARADAATRKGETRARLRTRFPSLGQKPPPQPRQRTVRAAR